MKKILLASAFSFGLLATKATVHTVTISGTTFTPATVSANVGDTVAWVITGSHTATEVSSSTWASSGTTPLPGGFNFNAASTSSLSSWIKVTVVGTRWYVCQPHASMGMKGQINVSGGTGIADETSKELAVSLYPNPANDFINLNVTGNENSLVQIEMISLLGNKVLDMGGKQTLTNGVKRIDISTLPKGVYFLNIVADNKNKSIRFVKQ